MPFPRGDRPLTDIKRIVLDVLKPHKPSLVDMSVRLSSLKGVDGVTCTLDEVDQETESVKVTIEGPSINYPSVEGALRELGAVIHSVDLVASGKRAGEDVRTGQDHRGGPLPGLLDPLRDLLENRGLVVVRPHEDASLFPPRGRWERLPFLELGLETEGFRRRGHLLGGGGFDGPSFRDAPALVPRSRQVEVCGV